MRLRGKVAVVTGGASGIGAALCRRFAKEAAEAVVVADLDGDGAGRISAEVGGIAFKADVSREADVVRLVEDTLGRFGRIDLFCSNAGIGTRDPGHAASSPNESWERSWGVHVMAHVYAARAVLPHMIERGEGYLLNTASAAGLLNQIGSSPYAVTKHASVALAESLAIAHGDDGVRVSVLCPQAVQTPMLGTASTTGGKAAAVDGVIQAEDVAQSVVEGLAEERFLILPHPDVMTYMRRKTSDYDRWLAGMRRLRRRLLGLE